MTEIDAVEHALRLARAELSAPEDTVERVWLRLPGAAPASAPPPQQPWAAAKATGLSGVVVAAALVGGGFALGYWARDASAPLAVVAAPGRPLAPPATASLPAPVLDVPPAVTVAVPAAPSAAPVVSISARDPGRRTTRSGAPGDQSQQELSLLARIERALRNDDAALALALLSELEQRFPETGLREEREAARLMSHCIQKREGSAAAARVFSLEHPASVYLSRLRALCALSSTREGESLTGSATPDTDGR